MEEWIQNRTIKELKILMNIKELPWNGLERNEIVKLIVENYTDLEEVKAVLSSVLDDDTLGKLQRILSEDRHLLNFTSYQTSEEHKLRISTRPARMNIDRELWFKHPNYPRRHQMPTYHVHFREEMQHVLSLLLSWFQNSSSREFNKAFQFFQNSMEGLHGHVHIEERSFFPQLQSSNPDFDIKFLYQDHQVLHDAEDKLKRKFEFIKRNIQNGKENLVTNQDKLTLLRLAVEFDEILINHLGEEEEIVVPLCLL